MVGWHHRLNGHEFEQAPGVDDGQGGLVCCSPWGRKESHTTEQLNLFTYLLLLAIIDPIYQTVVLEKTLKSLLDCKEIKPVNPKGNQF